MARLTQKYGKRRGSGSTSSSSTDLSPRAEHQWVEGNLPLNAVCTVCTVAAGSEPALADFRCVWCQHTVHTACLADLEGPCPLSPIPDVAVPPHLISPAPNWTRISPTRKEPRFLVQDLPEGLVPLLCVINPSSGSQNSPALLHALYAIVNPVQIVDTSRENPESLLRGFLPVLDRCRILVCGGDGTVGWVFSILDKILPTGATRPPVAILPLGTGNDLARILGWGAGWAGEDVRQIMQEVVAAEEVDLDRWTLTVEVKEKVSAPTRVGRALHLVPKKQVKTLVMNNYFSVGTDASVGLPLRAFEYLGLESLQNAPTNAIRVCFTQTSTRRASVNHSIFVQGTDRACVTERVLQMQTGRHLNKIWYALIGGKHQFWRVLSTIGICGPPSPPSPALVPAVPTDTTPPPSPVLHEPLSASTLRLDSSPTAIDLTPMAGLLVLNIPSYGGGGRIYATAESEGHPLSRIDDGKLELMSVSSPLHLGASVVGLSSPSVVGQATRVRVDIEAAELDMQVDGEPWRQQGPCSVTISFFGRQRVLRGTNTTG
ncbi:ATP-NAD kinase-like domain-containing protein [Blyttiomyces helicus]|uniref:Diacylglycerol kinase n=1 Tax=Blyttiomyces helicus TaxID=388810 RepID=A0A4P9WB49_9FUNG|nr:ATP-NAD kinase-like domain-containing protein [Blyttiomyces helicus]|eukprot:RKO88130.1 ATP-NAD kinase-like domain-containing protein [Blyttiomyces helicus]